MNVNKTDNADLQGLLAPKHTGMIINAHGILGRIRDGRYYNNLDYGCGEMLRHLKQMAERFYAGDPKAVDEFLQLYALDERRPETPNDQGNSVSQISQTEPKA